MNCFASLSLICALLVEIETASYVITDDSLSPYSPTNGLAFASRRDSSHMMYDDYDVTSSDDMAFGLNYDDYMDKRVADGGEIFGQYGYLQNQNSVSKRDKYRHLSMTKRIHTCAFMRRLGLPIGLCFNGRRVNKQTPRQRTSGPEKTPAKDAYAYLQRSWPVHSMLGGGVGR